MRKKSKWDIEHITFKGEKVSKNNEKSYSIKKHIKKVLIIFLVLYVIFLLYGYIITRFYKNPNGEIVPYKVSISDLKMKDDYDALKNQVTDLRILLRDITILDIHFSNGDYTNYEAATLYTKILDEKLDVMIPKVNSMNLQDENASIQKELESILSYDLALYLQNISKALQNGNEGLLSTALEYREKAFKTYEIIISDVKELASELKIEDIEFFDWSLNEAVKKEDNTAILKTKEGK